MATSDRQKEGEPMRVQQSRTEVLPLTWEIPATIAASWLFLALSALPVAHAASSWIRGEGFAWPDHRVVETTLDVLRGRPDGNAVVVYALVAFLEVGVAVLGVLALALWWRAYGPGAQHGLATRHQVAMVLGPRNLRRRSPVIRPDLNGSAPGPEGTEP